MLIDEGDVNNMDFLHNEMHEYFSNNDAGINSVHEYICDNWPDNVSLENFDNIENFLTDERINYINDGDLVDEEGDLHDISSSNMLLNNVPIGTPKKCDAIMINNNDQKTTEEQQNQQKVVAKR